MRSYGEEVWWAATLMTTIGPSDWPQTVEGRLLWWLLSLYAFVVFGYITANLASHFLGTEGAPTPADEDGIDTVPAAPDVSTLQAEIAALCAQLALLTRRLEQAGGPPHSGALPGADGSLRVRSQYRLEDAETPNHVERTKDTLDRGRYARSL